MDLTEKQLESKTVYDGLIVTVKMDRVTLPNGHTARREVVEHPGGVAILPIDSEGNAYVVSQYRYPFRKVLTEIPAGKMERGEEPLACAVRELEEEIGAAAGEMTYLGAMLPSPGFCDEVLHMYLAQSLTFGPCHPDEDEFLKIQRLPFSQLAEEVLTGRIQDGKTVCAVLKAKALLGL